MFVGTNTKRGTYLDLLVGLLMAQIQCIQVAIDQLVVVIWSIDFTIHFHNKYQKLIQIVSLAIFYLVIFSKTFCQLYENLSIQLYNMQVHIHRPYDDNTKIDSHSPQVGSSSSIDHTKALKRRMKRSSPKTWKL